MPSTAGATAHRRTHVRVSVTSYRAADSRNPGAADRSDPLRPFKHPCAVTRHSTNRLTVKKHRHMLNYMVELEALPLSDIFHALSDATRRRMLLELASGERTVGQLARPFSMSLAAASKHIKVLERAGLISREVRGRAHLCRLDPGPLESAHEWLSFYERFWTVRLDVLDRLLREEEARDADGTENSLSPKDKTPIPREGDEQ
jgi:DNA-binding transcriptional ArsR family regulator